MSNFLKTVFGSSWRTTLAGYGTAAAVSAADYVQANGDLSHLDVKSLVAAVGIAVLGRFAKATNVSNSPTPLADGHEVVATAVPPPPVVHLDQLPRA